MYEGDFGGEMGKVGLLPPIKAPEFFYFLSCGAHRVSPSPGELGVNLGGIKSVIPH